MPDKKLFDLHIEVGYDSDTGDKYGKIVLSDGSKFENRSSYLTDSVSGLIYDIDSKGGINALRNDPKLSVFPAPGAAISQKNGNQLQAPDPNDPKKLPSECTQIPDIECQLFCSSFANFKTAKCKSMCAGRKDF